MNFASLNISSSFFQTALIILIAAVLVFIIFKIILSHLRRKHEILRGLGMVLLEITLPREQTEEGKTFKEIVAGMEEFYAGMGAIKVGKWETFFYGAPYFTLEIGLPSNGSEIVFYSAVPRLKRQLFEKHLHAIFPLSKVSEVKNDYNIFKYKGVSAGAIAQLKTYHQLPIKIYDKFDSDPLGVIINSFSKLQKMGEGAALQLVVSPFNDKEVARKTSLALEEARRGKTLKEALSGKRSVSKNKEEGEQKNPVDEKLVEYFERKVSKQIFRVNIRLVVSAEDKTKADLILQEAQSAFLQFDEPQANGLEFVKLKKGALKKFFYQFSFRIFNKKNAIPLNTAELTSIFHFPATLIGSHQLKYKRSSEAAAPQNIATSGTLIGKNDYRGEGTEIYITPNDRRRHFYIIGQTGTGKTHFMKNMIAQDIRNGDGVCFIDPHGSDIEDILSIIPLERFEDVIYFDPADSARPMGLNLLEYDPNYPEQKTFVVNELFGIFKKLYAEGSPEAFGPMFEQYFRNATLLVIDNDPQATLLDVSKVMSNKTFRDQKIASCANPIVKAFWRDVAEKAGGEAALANIVPYITSKFDTFLANDVMRPIIAQKVSAFNFRKIMDDGKILLINLSKGRLGELNANLLGLIVVGKLLMASLSRVDTAEDARRDFYLYIDEFQNVTTSSISTILSEARKYRLNLTIAHQFIGQLDESIKRAVFGNVGSMAVFRIGAEDAETLKTQFEPIFGVSDLINIENYNAYLRLLVNGEPALPFNIKTYPFEKGDPAVAENIKNPSRSKFGRPREEVEAEISQMYL